MSNVLDQVIPIFVLIAVGWLSTATRLLSERSGDALGDFVFRVAVPVLIFRTLATADVHGSPWALWSAYFSGVVVAWTAGHLIATRVFGRDRRLGVIAGVSAGFANNIFIGLPLVDRVAGAEGVAAVSILLAIHLPVMTLAGTLLMERAARQEADRRRDVLAVVREVARNLAVNPLVLALAAGFLARVAGLPIGGMPGTIVDQVAGTAGPLALIALGMALHRYGIRGNLGLAAALTALKLMVMPAVVLGACRLLGLDPLWTLALVLTSSVPTGVNAFLIANRFNVGQGLASSAISLSTALGVLSVSFWIAVLAG